MTRAGRGAIAIALMLGSLALPTLAQAADPVTTINSSITGSDPTQTNRLFRNGVAPTCASPGLMSTIAAAGPHYKTFTIPSLINETACLTLAFNTACTGTNFIQSGVYNGSFDPTSITTNGIAAEGASPNPTDSYQSSSTAGQTLVLAVNEVTPGAGCSAFTATITSDRPWATARPQVRLAGSDASGQSISIGSLLTAQPGGWTASVADTFKWRSCDAAGNNCTDIVGAAGPTFTPDISFVGKTLRVIDSANDTSGTSSSTSVATGLVKLQRTLTVTKSGAGSGTVTSSPAGIDCGATCSHSFDPGAQVALTATPASGSTFGGWGVACSGTGSCSLTMSGDLDVSATFAPDNRFTLAKPKLNRKKGTATLTATVPGPGKLVLKGNGLKKTSASAHGAGKVKLKVKVAKKTAKKLKSKGKAKVTAKVTYTPTGGKANTESKKIKLIRKR